MSNRHEAQWRQHSGELVAGAACHGLIPTPSATVATHWVYPVADEADDLVVYAIERTPEAARAAAESYLAGGAA